MSRLIPNDADDEFAWICGEGHWNRSSENFCRECKEPKPTTPDVLREQQERLKLIHEKHPRKLERITDDDKP